MIKIYNSLTKRKEVFKTYTPGEVRMYTCGPTVYFYAHIGNMRAYLFMDQVRRMLKFNGYKILGVMNLTDVGHLTSDSDEGDDKMEIASKRENKSPYEIAQFYIDAFLQDCTKLNIDLPSLVVKASDYVAEMIELNKILEAKGYTYVLDDGLYFDVQKYKDYGRLSNKDMNADRVARIEENVNKKHPFDFALWKFVPSNHIMKWDSPWGVGCPGWHIECTAMGMKYLGDKIDIHTGGIDHLSIHHENEIAQNYGVCGHDVVKIWMHNEFLQVDGGKMGKSLNNLYRISQLEEMGYDPLDYRYFNALTHYRKKNNFTFNAIKSAQNARKSLIDILIEHKNSDKVLSEKEKEEWLKKFKDAINDDLNYPLAVGVIWQMVKCERSRDIYELALTMDEALGLRLKESTCTDEVPNKILILAQKRWEFKQSKDFTAADKLRTQIDNLGYIIKDQKDKYQIFKK